MTPHPTGQYNKKSVLASPSRSEASSSGVTPSTPTGTLSTPKMNRHRLQFNEVVDKSKSLLVKEGHQKRLKMLRKELDYLNETAWQYQPIEAYIGH